MTRNIFSSFRKIIINTEAQKYFFNTSWMLLDKVAMMGINLFVGVYVARYLEPEQFGILSYALSVVVIFSPLTTLGLQDIVVREIVKSPDKRNVYLGSTFYLKFAGAVVLISMVAVLVYFQKGSRVENTLLIIIAAGMLLDTFQVCDYYNQAMVKMRYSAIASFTANICYAIFRLWLIYINADLVWFAISLIFQKSILATVWSILYWVDCDCFRLWKFSLTEAKSLLRDAWPLFLASISVMVYLRVDQVMLKWLSDEKSVGEYAAAVNLSEASYWIPVLICQSLSPMIIKAHQTDKVLYKKKIRKLYGYLILYSYTVAVPVAAFSDWMMPLLYGPQYIDTGRILAIHICALVFVSLGLASNLWLTTENYTVLAFWRTFIGMLINIVTNFILIPYYSAVGAAWATLLSYAFAGYLFDFFNRKTRFVFKEKTSELLTLSSLWR